MTSEETADRFDNRAGYKLIAYGTVGLPLYRLTTVGLCVAKRSLDPIEEFVLRGVMAGTQYVHDTAGLLGLDASVVQSCLAELVRYGMRQGANCGRCWSAASGTYGEGTGLVAGSRSHSTGRADSGLLRGWAYESTAVLSI